MKIVGVQHCRWLKVSNLIQNVSSPLTLPASCLPYPWETRHAKCKKFLGKCPQRKKEAFVPKFTFQKLSHHFFCLRYFFKLSILEKNIKYKFNCFGKQCTCFLCANIEKPSDASEAKDADTIKQDIHVAIFRD